MSRDVTAWDALDLRTRTGVPVPEGDRETIVDVANKALQDGYRDPKQVLQAATRVDSQALHERQSIQAPGPRAHREFPGATVVWSLVETQTALPTLP